MFAMLVITVFFPQRVDESFDTAGEEPSPATEDFDQSQFASEGKPTFKTQPKCPTFLHSLYHVFIIHVLLQLGWIIVVVLGEPPYTLYPSAMVLITQLLPSHVHSWYCGNV